MQRPSNEHLFAKLEHGEKKKKKKTIQEKKLVNWEKGISAGVVFRRTRASLSAAAHR